MEEHKRPHLFELMELLEHSGDLDFLAKLEMLLYQIGIHRKNGM